MDYKQHNKQIDEQYEVVLKKKLELLELLDQQETKLEELFNSKRFDTKILFLDGTEDIISSNKYNDCKTIRNEITKRYGHTRFKLFDTDENKKYNFYSEKHPENLFITILSIDDKVKEYLKDAKYRTMTEKEKKLKNAGRLFTFDVNYNQYDYNVRDYVILKLKKGYRFTIEKRTPKTILVDAGNFQFRKTIKERSVLGFEFIDYEGERYFQIDEEFDTDLEYIVVKL
jgi:hypothetical protein